MREFGSQPEEVSRSIRKKQAERLTSESHDHLQRGKELNLDQIATHGIRKRGIVDLGGVRYCLGSEFATGEFQAISLDEHTGAIVTQDEQTGRYRITNLFDRIPLDDPRLHISNSEQQRIMKRYAERSVNHIESFTEEEFAVKRPDESEKAHSLRLHAYDRLFMSPEERARDNKEQHEENWETQRKRMQEALFDELENQGILERIDDTRVIIQKEKLQKELSRALRTPSVRHARGEEWTAIRYAMSSAFQDVDVIAREEWEQAEKEKREPKAMPLMYQPESKKGAFNAEVIKGTKFHFAPWEFEKSTFQEDKILTVNGDTLNDSEASIALLVYHPRYGNGYRDPSGRLYVMYPSMGEAHPISTTWFEDEMGRSFGNKNKSGENIFSPKLFLPRFAPHCIETGILKPEDFRHMSTTLTGERFRSERTVGEGGNVMIGSVNYYIGKTEELRGAPVVAVDPHTAAVLREDPISHQKVISHTFSLLERDDPRLGIQTRSKTGNITYRAPKSLVDLRPYSREQFFRRRMGEKPEDYTARARSLEDFDYLLKLSDRLSKEAGVNLSVVDFENQSIISSAVKAFRKQPEQLVNFAKRFGIDGVKSFIGFSHDEQCIDKIFAVTDQLDETDAKKIFGEYSRLVDFASSFDKKLAPEFQRRLGGAFDKNGWYERLMHRGSELLDAVYEKTSEDNPLSYEELMKELAREDSRLSFSDAHESVIQRVAIELANRFGVEEIRTILNATDVAESDEILSFINPEVSPEIHRDLRNLYDSIHFEDYAVNKRMDERDMAFLQRHIPKNGTVLDLGAGTGRHLIPLHQKGVNVHGLDYVKRHAGLAKHGAPDAGVVQGDWAHSPFQSGKFATVYSLGRNILHEFQPHRQEQLFQEANRVLQMSGEFVFDIPDRERGGYAQLVKGYAQKLRERGMRNFRSGTIYDSPDHKNYFTRYAYSREDIEHLAAAAGFEIVSVEEMPLETGKDDVNLYYTLRKVSEVPSEVGEGGEEEKDTSELSRAA